MLGALICVGLLLLSTLALYSLSEHQASGAWQGVSTAPLVQKQPSRHARMGATAIRDIWVMPPAAVILLLLFMERLAMIAWPQ